MQFLVRSSWGLVCVGQVHKVVKHERTVHAEFLIHSGCVLCQFEVVTVNIYTLEK